jgi:23S rRNA (cytidine2498-2'-O)-methyltransferase
VAVLFSASEPFFAEATRELQRTIGGIKVRRLGPDLGVAAGELDVAAVADAVRSTQLVFVRHLSEAIAIPERPIAHRAVGEAILAAIGRHGASTVALQAWASVPPGSHERPDRLRSELARTMSEAGIDVRAAGQRVVVSVCLTTSAIAIGVADVADALADWPGGRPRFRRRPELVSRSEFKLEEVINVLNVPLPHEGTALDLGASPGGWTRILREHGLGVWAVDPADLHPRLADDPQVRHLRMTAGRFLQTTSPLFSAVVNDMRMEPELSAHITRRAAQRVVPDGLVVMTCKLVSRMALQTVATVRGILAPDVEITHLRQLYHNRDEVTVVGRARPS